MRKRLQKWGTVRVLVLVLSFLGGIGLRFTDIIWIFRLFVRFWFLADFNFICYFEFWSNIIIYLGTSSSSSSYRVRWMLVGWYCGLVVTLEEDTRWTQSFRGGRSAAWDRWTSCRIFRGREYRSHRWSRRVAGCFERRPPSCRQASEPVFG